MSLEVWKKKLGKFYFVMFCCIGAATTLIVLFSDEVSFEATPNPLALADVSVHSDHVTEIASALEKSPVFVDPLLADTVGRSVDADEVRSAIDASDTPVFVVATPTFDEGTGANELLLARIADAADREGVYLLLGEEGRIDHVAHEMRFDRQRLFLQRGLNDAVDAPAVAGVVLQIDEAVDDALERQQTDDGGDNPFWLGVLMGVCFSVPLWYLMKFIRWSARRDRSYLKGFRA